jgi:hypothetical protein
VTSEVLQTSLLAAITDPQNTDLARSRYDVTIERLEATVDPSKVHYAFYETLFVQDEVDRLCRFLGVEPTRASLERRRNAARDGAAELEECVYDEARVVLDPVYQFVLRRFGGVPDRWT